MVSELTGPLGSATRGPWVWCPAQLTLHLVCAGPWSRGRTCGLGRGMGLVQGGLTEPPGPAAPFGLCHSTGHLSCHYCSLDQEGLKGTRRSVSSSHPGLSTEQATVKCQKRGKGVFRGRKGTCRAVVVGLVEAPRRGRMLPERAEPPSRPSGCIICPPRRRPAALSGLLRSTVPLCQPGSAAQLIPAATATCSGHFLC